MLKNEAVKSLVQDLITTPGSIKLDPGDIDTVISSIVNYNIDRYYMGCLLVYANAKHRNIPVPVAFLKARGTNMFARFNTNIVVKDTMEAAGLTERFVVSNISYLRYSDGMTQMLKDSTFGDYWQYWLDKDTVIEELKDVSAAIPFKIVTELGKGTNIVLNGYRENCICFNGPAIDYTLTYDSEEISNEVNFGYVPSYLSQAESQWVYGLDLQIEECKSYFRTLKVLQYLYCLAADIDETGKAKYGSTGGYHVNRDNDLSHASWTYAEYCRLAVNNAPEDFFDEVPIGVDLVEVVRQKAVDLTKLLTLRKEYVEVCESKLHKAVELLLNLNDHTRTVLVIVPSEESAKKLTRLLAGCSTVIHTGDLKKVKEETSHKLTYGRAVYYNTEFIRSLELGIDRRNNRQTVDQMINDKKKSFVIVTTKFTKDFTKMLPKFNGTFWLTNPRLIQTITSGKGSNIYEYVTPDDIMKQVGTVSTMPVWHVQLVSELENDAFILNHNSVKLDTLYEEAFI